MKAESLHTSTHKILSAEIKYTHHISLTDTNFMYHLGQ